MYPIGKLAKRLGLMQCWTCFVCQNRPASRLQFALLTVRIADRCGRGTTTAPVLGLDELILVERAAQELSSELDKFLIDHDTQLDSWRRGARQLWFENALRIAWANTARAAAAAPQVHKSIDEELHELLKDPVGHDLFRTSSPTDPTNIGLTRLFRSNQLPGCGPRTQRSRPIALYQLVVSLDRSIHCTRKKEMPKADHAATLATLNFLAIDALDRIQKERKAKLAAPVADQ